MRPFNKKKKRKKASYLLPFVIIVVMASFILYKKLTAPSYDDPRLPRAFKGQESAKVVITEYSDFQCPACKAAQDNLKAVLREKGDVVRLDYRHFPLTAIHPYAFKAAEAFECAHDQGKAWEMHDLLFENQPRINEADILVIADELSLDTDGFKACLASGAKARIVKDDLREGRRRRLDGTPTFFVNGHKVSNWQILATEVALEIEKPSP